MSSAEGGRIPSRPPRPPPSRAIAIPRDDDEDSEIWAASPGAESYVANNDSWRPMPPPMLASSLDISTRFRPSLTARPDVAEDTLSISTSTSRSSSLQQLPPLAPDASTYGAIQPAPHVQVPPLAALVQQQKTRRKHEVTPPPVRGRSASVKAKMARLLVHLRQLEEAPRELWLIFALKFLSSYAYFSLSLVLTLFLTEEFGMSDTAAGWTYGAYGVMSTFFGLLCGWFIDYLGVRVSLMVGAIIGAASRFIMAVTLSRKIAVLMLYSLLPFAECLGIPIMTIGIKRYTSSHNRTFAFSLFYSMMNVAALCAGPLVDLARRLFGEGVTVDMYAFGPVRLSGLRLVILSSAIATALMILVVIIGIREVHVDETGTVQEFTPNRESPLTQTREVLQDPAFWRLTLFTLLLIGVRLVFRHLDATLPKYLIRQFGPYAPFGLIYAINPFLIIFLVPLVGLMTRRIQSFPMIVAGSFVSALSPFWIAIKQTYVGVVLFMVTLSIGEAVYSPRVYEYTMEVSAHGSEGLYSSLSTAPLFSVKLLVGGMSGWLLTSFMPATGPHHGAMLWTIIGITSLTSPVLMCLLREYISPSEEQTELPRKGELENVHKPVKRGGSIPVSAARPPTGPSAAIRINRSFNDLEDTEEAELLPSSLRGRSPLSLPPFSPRTSRSLLPTASSPNTNRDSQG
ncbi:hypothetical protein BWQ96_02297 [Gracilariopsis chorda]|uniref:Major facilitator superfamily (MFS) profile domain-containing protein n=1 Tax=Gracilariopsis chorda TaxID=448386 RepID=A0A2V3J0J0_9FLOR|nr:hypothetical protein BWQ96_02297 [Gracilariopsis chorda]|eukprot:PXF47911.1 hypothetical protein BWQ96_02297 [Gracilariopsis chorda]